MHQNKDFVDLRNKGSRLLAHRSMVGVSKPNSIKAKGYNSEYIPIEELETIGIGSYSYKYTENMLRKEHGLPNRLLYYGKLK